MKRILPLLLLSVLFAGCNKYIDINEKGKVIPKSINDFNQLLGNSGVLAMSCSNPLYSSDEIKVYKDEASRIFYGAEMFTNGFLWNDYVFNNTSDNDLDWNYLYSQVYICNLVLKYIDDATGSDETLRKTTKGEALAHRAYAYFILTNEYGKHYNPATYATDLAVPLYLEPDINAAKARATVKECYELIENDLKAALDLLPNTPVFNYRPGKGGVNGLLAKMYLYQAKYELARSHADAALKINSFLYNFAAFEYLNPALKFLGLKDFPRLYQDNKEAIWHKESNNRYSYVIAVYYTQEHKDLYDPEDRRLYFSQIEAGPGGPNAHGAGLNAKEQYYKAGVYTPELYLIRAECNARLSQPGTAIDDLNTLREKRFNAGKFVAYDRNQTDLDALKLVLKERRIELVQEVWRWFDLKRLNLDPQFRRDITRDWGGQTHTLQPDSKNYVFAIPKKVMDLNKLMVQNERDNKQAQ